MIQIELERHAQLRGYENVSASVPATVPRLAEWSAQGQQQVPWRGVNNRQYESLETSQLQQKRPVITIFGHRGAGQDRQDKENGLVRLKILN